LFGAGRQWRQMAFSTIGLLLLYAASIYVAGLRTVIESIAPALFLALIIEDPLILSQHTHIPQRVSRGAQAHPFAAMEQQEFTRSLHFPTAVSKFVLFNFDAHELHHMYPFVPGYHLRRIPYTGVNEIQWWRWLTAAKRIPGEDFLFRNQNDTGIHI
jgi:fatty acid desaturase